MAVGRGRYGGGRRLSVLGHAASSSANDAGRGGGAGGRRLRPPAARRPVGRGHHLRQRGRCVAGGGHRPRGRRGARPRSGPVRDPFRFLGEVRRGDAGARRRRGAGRTLRRAGRVDIASGHRAVLRQRDRRGVGGRRVEGHLAARMAGILDSPGDAGRADPSRRHGSADDRGPGRRGTSPRRTPPWSTRKPGATTCAGAA